MRRGCTCTVLSLAFAFILSGQEHILRHIDFFGYEGLDIAAIRDALPFREGDTFQMTSQLSDEWKQAANQVVRRFTGHDPTDVSVVIYKGGDMLVYIGLMGKSAGQVPYNTIPNGDSRLPLNIVKLNDEMANALIKAVQEGATSDDDSKGYALSTDTATRARQLELHDYALENESVIMQVLESSSDAGHRAIAATALGYARQTDKQVTALAKASFDSNSSVRNAAIRALAVLVKAKPEVGRLIPVNRFVDLLRSGSWTDRNKACFLISSLTYARGAELLDQLRSRALTPLMEMAEWGTDGHGYDAGMILGRIAGIEEERLKELLKTRQMDAIVSALESGR